ncbi:hypothetical protein ACF1DY_25930 [Streptomyces albus]
MRLTLPQGELAGATQWVARQLPNQPLNPVLMAMRLTAEAGRLALSGFDGATATRVTIDADVDTPGTAHVSARLVADVAAAFGKTDITLDDSSGELVATTARGQVTLPVLDGGDAPTPPVGPDPSGAVDGDALAAAYKRIKTAVDPKAQGTFAGMAGVRFLADGGCLQLAATDRYRVAQAWLPWDEAPHGEVMAVVPDKTLANNIGAFAEASVRMALPSDGHGTARISNSRHQVVASLLDPNTYPHRVDEVVPTEFVGTASFEAAEAAEALKQVTVVTEPGKPVWLRLADGTATLRARDHGAATASFACEWSGDVGEFEAAWNGRYLGDGISSFLGAVHMQVTTPARPAVLVDPEDDSYRYTVIPIRDPKGA